MSHLRVIWPEGDREQVREHSVRVLTLEDLARLDPILSNALDAGCDLEHALGQCDPEQTIRALRRLVAVGGLAQAAANRLEGHK